MDLKHLDGNYNHWNPGIIELNGIQLLYHLKCFFFLKKVYKISACPKLISPEIFSYFAEKAVSGNPPVKYLSSGPLIVVLILQDKSIHCEHSEIPEGDFERLEVATRGVL